jgi:hypothetical protein
VTSFPKTTPLLYLFTRISCRNFWPAKILSGNTDQARGGEGLFHNFYSPAFIQINCHNPQDPLKINGLFCSTIQRNSGGKVFGSFTKYVIFVTYKIGHTYCIVNMIMMYNKLSLLSVSLHFVIFIAVDEAIALHNLG